MNRKIVAKFGGSSVKDSQAMRRCLNIVKNNSDIKVVILSATWNTTNQLEKLAQLAIEKKEADNSKLMQELIDKHSLLIKDLNLSSGLDKDLINSLQRVNRDFLERGEFSPELMDEMYSIGERWSSLIFSSLLKKELEANVVLVDSREIIKTDEQFQLANPLFDLINTKAQKILVPLENSLVVLQGFIGETLSGLTTTLGREGSDYSATIIGAAIGANEVQIWTDVDGIAKCDPRLVPSAEFLNEISYEDAALMANLGAKVLFPRTLEPVIEKEIPVRVLSTLKESPIGTLITKASTQSGIVGICSKKVRDGHIISIVGNEDQIYKLEFEFSEIDRGPRHRSWLVQLDEDNSFYPKFYQKIFS